MSEFKCPACGSDCFRSDISARPWVGHCKGKFLGRMHEYAGCDFTWERTDEEDAKVGLGGELI